MSVNLLDVTITPRVVETVRYGSLNVHGLSIKGLAFLIKRHPELFKVFDQKGQTELNAGQLIDLGSEVLVDFLCSGLGYPGGSEGYEKARQLCSEMNGEDAFTICQAILEESFPGGATNFFERVAQAVNQAGILQKAHSNNHSEAPKDEEDQTKAS